MTRKRSNHLWLLLGAFLLAACGGEERVNYRLSSVLPSPALPGEVVTLTGVFPEEARLELDGAAVPVTPAPAGLQFTLPEEVVAGEHELSVPTDRAALSGTLQVAPRIDGATLNGERLTVTGAGWPGGSSPQTFIEVGGRRLEPVPSPGRLEAMLPEDLAYGALSLRVVVNDQASAPYTLQLEAGAVTGTVLFPAQESASLTPSFIPQAAPERDPTNLIVFHAPGALEPFLADYGGVLEVTPLPPLGATRLVFGDAASARAAFASLGKLEGVTGLEWDASVHTDGAFAVQAAPPAQPGAGQWHLPLMGAPEAWERTRGEGVVVAVLDTGVELKHPDLADKLLPGYDFVDGDADPSDRAGHGTHVAGLVAADGHVLGVAPGASLLPVRVLEGDAGGSAFTVAQGLLWAADLLPELPNPHPAGVVNLSLGTTSYPTVLADAIARAQETGVVVVAASGNSGGPVAYPAALPGVVAVTSLAGPKLAYQPWYANRGPGVWLSAYGGDTTQDQDGDGAMDGVLSTEPGGYGLRMGTSMAAPQVAGLAALALAAGTPPFLVRDTLAATATELGPRGYDTAFGHGLATGRAASSSTPRAYVLALEGERVVGWTLVQADGSYELADLPPGRPLRLVAASDEDGDAHLAEAGELLSSSLTLTPRAGELLPVDALTLTPTGGQAAVLLEAQP